MMAIESMNVATAISGPPSISEWTRSGGPGDVIVLKGQNFGADLKVFVSTSQVGALSVPVEFIDSGEAVVRLPDSLKAGEVYALVASNSEGMSAGITVNSPELWWVGPNDIAPGGTTSIFGRNLAISSTSQPIVQLEMTDGPQAGSTVALKVVKADNYRVDVQIPENLPEGHYTLRLSNGSDSAAATTEGKDVTIDAALSHDWGGTDHVVINAADYGAIANDGQDDAAGLQAAIDAGRALVKSGKAAEVTVQLEAGTYAVSQATFFDDGINLQGRGAGKTIITPTADFATKGDLANYAYILWARAGQSSSYGEQTGSRIGDLTIDTKANPKILAVNARGADHLTIDKVELFAKGSDTIDAHDTTFFTLSNSKVVGKAVYLGSAKQVFVYGNDFYGTDQTGENIVGSGASDVAIYGNKAQHYDSTPTAETYMTDAFQGRFYVAQTHLGQSANQYIAGNQTTDLAPHIEYENLGLHVNAGEQILFEDSNITARIDLSSGILRSSTTETLSFNQDPPDAATAGVLTVVSGTGAGATAQIDHYDAQTHTLYFADKLNVKLDATSVVMISRSPSHVAIVGNTLDGRAENVAASEHSASTGVQVYPGGSKVVIDGNTFQDLREGVGLWSFPSDGHSGTPELAGVNFFDIKNNKFVNTNTGVSFYMDPGGAADLGQSPSVVEPHMTVGTTIQHNDFSGVNNLAVNVSTRQSFSPVDIAAANVASQNILPSGTAFGGIGFDGNSGSPNLLIMNDQSSALPTQFDLAQDLKFEALGRYFGTLPEPAFQASIGSDGTILLRQVRGVAATVDGQAAMEVTAGATNDVGFGSDNWQSTVEVLHGGAGDDIIFGSAGKDVLTGDAGSDLLAGGSGSVTLEGGSGSDVFAFRPTLIGDLDTIKDFNRSEGDKVLIADIPSSVTDPFASGYVKVAAEAGGSVIMLDANGGGDAFVRTAVTPGISLTTSDFIFGTGSGGSGGTSDPDASGGTGDTGGTGGTGDTGSTGGTGDTGGTGGTGDTGGTGGTGGSVAPSGGLTGTDGTDVLTGTVAAETISGLGGNDILEGGGGNDTLAGGAGNDLLSGGQGVVLDGGDGDDRFDLTGTPAALDGGAGVDLVRIVGAVDFTKLVPANVERYEVANGGNVDFGAIPGGVTVSVITTTGGSSTIKGTGLSDTIYADSTGSDVVQGRGGDDRIYGGSGDKLYGAAGNDVFVISSLPTSIDGGAGTDKLVIDGNVTFGAQGITKIESFEISGGATADFSKMSVGVKATSLSTATTTAQTVLIGTTLSDKLSGSVGVDVLQGGSGSDVLTGGHGRDLLTGGAGRDSFVFQSVEDSPAGNAPDVIIDWESRDRIDLSALDSNSADAGHQAFTFAGQGSPTESIAQGQIKYYHSGDSTYVAGNIDADGQPDFVIQLQGLQTLTSANFVL